ncbi:MAG: ATP-binding protein [Pseudomonadota bacterium]
MTAFRHIAMPLLLFGMTVLIFPGSAPASAAAALPPFDAKAIRALLRDDPVAGRERAVAYLDEELAPDTLEYSHAARLVSIGYGMEGRLDEALTYGRLANRVARRLDEPATIARTLTNIGTIHRLRGDIAEAIDAYRGAIDIARDRGLTDVLIATLANQTELLIAYGAERQALDVALETEALLGERANPGIYPAVAYAFSLNGRPRDAQAVLARGRALFPAEVPRELTALYSFQEALAADGLGDRAMAERLIDTCIAAVTGIDLPTPEIDCLDYGARFAIDRGDIAKAQDLVAKLAVLEAGGRDSPNVFPADADRLASRLLDLQIGIALATGNSRRALVLRRDKARVDDSMEATRQTFEMALVSAEFADRIRDARLQDLEQEAAVMDLRASRQRLLIIGSLALAAFLALGAVILYRTAQERRRLNATLATSLDAQTVLAKDIQHRAKNNLQLLISTLNLQRRHAGDNSAGSKALASQMQAMAMLHDLLYGADSADGGGGGGGGGGDGGVDGGDVNGGAANNVDARAYLVPLVEAMAQSHRGENQIAELDIAPVMLDTAIASPLGLIVTELVSNAFKHAPGGHIRVTLRALGPDRFRLTIEDDGPGFDPDTAKARGTLGLLLIEDLTAQLKGDIRHDPAVAHGSAGSRDNQGSRGSRWTLTAPRSHISHAHIPTAPGPGPGPVLAP